MIAKSTEKRADYKAFEILTHYIDQLNMGIARKIMKTDEQAQRQLQSTQLCGENMNNSGQRVGKLRKDSTIKSEKPRETHDQLQYLSNALTDHRKPDWISDVKRRVSKVENHNT